MSFPLCYETPSTLPGLQAPVMYEAEKAPAKWSDPSRDFSKDLASEASWSYFSSFKLAL